VVRCVINAVILVEWHNFPCGDGSRGGGIRRIQASLPCGDGLYVRRILPR
jgi:hypothetical protein